ncbi:MAG TPA: hypothetical protein VL175_15100, partial [Pirellulales bacterium]|nr:hypothetical protein [Pirellulales bacterium]
QAERAYLTAHTNLMSASGNIATERARHEAALAESAHPSIGAFIAKLRGEQARLRHEQPQIVESRSVNPATFGQRLIKSSYEKINARILAIREAVSSAEALQFIDADEPELQSRINKIWQSLPDTRIE